MNIKNNIKDSKISNSNITQAGITTNSHEKVTKIPNIELSENKNNNIFVIHGHSESKWRELSSLLSNNLKLNPIVLMEQADSGFTLIEKFESYAKQCSYAFALFTPDDYITNSSITYSQMRPNVIFELGWFYGHLGRDRVCILSQKNKDIKIFSDMSGIVYKEFHENIKECFIDIQNDLKTKGIIK